MIAVVTGGSQGIGAAIALAIREKGGTVIVLDQQTEGSDIQVDLGNPAEVAQACSALVVAHPRIDLLVNNAGTGGNWVPLEQQSLDDWDRTLSVNLRAAYLMAKGLLPSLKGGSIVNIASTRALMSEANTEAYAASKGGLVALTHSLAISLAPRSIRVNCISPGWIETGDYFSLSQAAHEQHPAGKVGCPENIAEAVLYLAEAKFVTGTNLVIDGGMTRKMSYIE